MVCKLCDKQISTRGMKKHLQKCVGIQNGGIVILFTSYNLFGKKHQLWVKAHNECTFFDIDKFLREHWVDCCGHASLINTNHMDFS